MPTILCYSHDSVVCVLLSLDFQPPSKDVSPPKKLTKKHWRGEITINE